MIKLKYLIYFSFTVLVYSCKENKNQLVINNLSEKNTLYTVVKINGVTQFSDSVRKSISNFSFESKKIHFNSDTLNVEVEIPQLGLKQSEVSMKKGIEQIFITIRSIQISPFPKEPGVLSSIPRKEEILIAFFNKGNTKEKAK